MRPFGRMLWEENARAIVSRNRDRAEGDGLAQAVADYRLWRHIGVPPTGLYALARFLDYQCDEDASFAQSNARAALTAVVEVGQATASKAWGRPSVACRRAKSFQISLLKSPVYGVSFTWRARSLPKNSRANCRPPRFT